MCNTDPTANLVYTDPNIRKTRLATLAFVSLFTLLPIIIILLLFGSTNTHIKYIQKCTVT